MTPPEDCKVESLKFGYNLTISLSQMLDTRTLCDTTLVCCDGSVTAHKVILAASSNFFRSVYSLPSLSHVQHPVIYLRNIKTIHMKSILHFLYTGVANVTEDDVDHFMKIGTELQIDGLMINNKRGRKRKTKESNDDDDIEKEKELLERVRAKYAVKPVSFDLDDVVSVSSSPPASPTPLLSRQNAVKKPRKKKDNLTTSTNKMFLYKSSIGNLESNEELLSGSDYCPMCNVKVGAGSLSEHMDKINITECHSCHKSFSSCNSLYDHKRGNCDK